LHVEDDPMQQHVLMHHLTSMEEFHFETTAVPSEDEAMAAFRAREFDMVVVDYQLAQGNGLHLLQRLRELDPVIPIIGISGVATSEVAADLVRAGADDYFDKRDLTSAKLAISVRAALLRAKTVRNRAKHSAGAVGSEIARLLSELSQYVADKVGAEFFRRLEKIETEARQAGLRARDFEQFYRSATSSTDSSDISPPLAAQQILRALVLELIVRLSGDMTENEIGHIARTS
jgi:DNA-binding response OmpR family regulator